MANAELTYRADRVPDRALSASQASKWATAAIIIGTISFNAALSFVNGHGVAISDLHVMTAEVLLIAAAILASRNYLNVEHLTVLALIILYTVVLSSVRYTEAPATGFDPKVSRDLMIPVVFFVLGRALSDIRAADRIVFAAAAFLLFIALFEYFFLDAYLRVFEVAKYYIARGTLSASQHALEVSQGLMVSGMRPTDQGRTLLPFLGDHRVSSLFLEPSTLGNFGAIITLWAAVRSRMEGKLFFWCAVSGLALVILSDTRFAGLLVLLGVGVLFLPLKISTPAVLVAPFATMLGLCVFAAWVGPFEGVTEVEGLGIYDRLLYSGRVLLSFDVFHWFGFEVSRAQTFNSGYGYVISNVGIVGFALLWIGFMSLKGHNQFFYSFRNILGLCFTALLCISASQFTIKLAGMLWLLLGVLSVAEAPVKRPQKSKQLQRLQLESDLRWCGSAHNTVPQSSSFQHS